VVEIEVVVDGSVKRFLFDTGAAASNLGSDDQSKAYPSLGKSKSRGASGNSVANDIVQPRKIELGSLKFEKYQIKRCENYTLDLDLLVNKIFQIDLRNLKVNFLEHMPFNVAPQSIKRLSPGHLTIPIKLETQMVDVLFDTGADSTVIDLQFIKQHSFQEF